MYISCPSKPSTETRRVTACSWPALALSARAPRPLLFLPLTSAPRPHRSLLHARRYCHSKLLHKGTSYSLPLLNSYSGRDSTLVHPANCHSLAYSFLEEPSVSEHLLQYMLYISLAFILPNPAVHDLQMAFPLTQSRQALRLALPLGADLRALTHLTRHFPSIPSSCDPAVHMQTKSPGLSSPTF